jgi:hypothetical protein
VSVQEIRALPRAEKLRLMEALWVELSRDEAELEPPAWHESALKETAQRFAEGREEILDWERAKEELRRKA